MILDADSLAHYGTPRHSGRYPWGSGGNETSNARDFLGLVSDLRKKGMTEVEIARGFGITTSELRAKKTIALNEKKSNDQATAFKLREKGMSVAAIARQMDIPDSTVRSLLKPGEQRKLDVLQSTASSLRQSVAEKQLIDIGSGVEQYMGVARPKLNAAIALLKEEGYGVYYMNVEQLGTGLQTRMKILAAPGMTYSDVYKSRDKIGSVAQFSKDGGLTYEKIKYPTSIDSKRVGIRYAEEGGTEADGVIYVRRGVDDVSLGGSNYAQVRIAVDGSHYIKGMAMYSDNMPPGKDIVFNTNKSDTGTLTDALKPLKDDVDLPMGSVITRQHGVMNIVNEEGDWDKWSANFSSQMLSKQSPTLIKSQLDASYDRRRTEYEEIMALTNPVVKKHMLDKFADGADTAAVHLKAAALPRTKSQVLLPISSLKETEIYAPNFRDGERVVLIRHPHGGTFEIPELVVNNKNPAARSSIGRNARDAVGINPKVAERLSGADFDGDHVLVIPNNRNEVNTTAPLVGLKGFDPKAAYPAYPGMRPMSARTKQLEMGKVSNLITDMTIRGASTDDLARAVRHSMVVIDAEKHNLDYRRSERENGIQALKDKYQGGGGASTLISRARSETRVPLSKPRSAEKGGPIDKATGKKVFEPTNEGYIDRNGNFVLKKVSVERLAATDDAYTLSSGTRIESLYANYSNKLKGLANDSRKESINTANRPYSPSAKKTYSSEVASLNAKLNLALKNAPLERQAQVIANAIVRAKVADNPGMEKDSLKKVKRKALEEARIRTGAKKNMISITPEEWNAIQAGAISTNKLTEILANADLDQIKAYATPRSQTLMTSSMTSRAKTMIAQGYTQAQVADALGVSLTTLKTVV